MNHLRALLKHLESAGLLVRKPGSASDIEIDHLASDSRAVGPGGLFVAIRGEQADGHLFIDKAVQNGAIAIVCEAVPKDARERYPGTAFAQVVNTRAALAELAAAFYDDPSRALKMIGVTGTNGKTTTAHLIHHLLSSLGETAGLIGTIEFRLGDESRPATHTTPDALKLNKMLREMAGQGCRSCVMEVSSHALDQDRVRAIQYDVAVFTNLTRDHLDYHGSPQAYLAAKKKLFDALPETATALYNADDPASPQLIADTAADVLAYGFSEEADVRIEMLENRIDGLRLRIDGTEQRFRLAGLFNAYNLAAAYSAGRALGYSASDALGALATAPPVPGRFETLRFAGGTTVVIDYAHTPDALENVLQAIRTTKSPAAALWCVFGCGGDRDAGKRRPMGALAESYADRVVVTSDNPRTEDPEGIMNDIRRGMDRPTEAAWIVDRREAIAYAAEHAAPGDVVLVAGKGHETYQIIGTERRPFDDCAVVQEVFGEMKGGKEEREKG